MTSRPLCIDIGNSNVCAVVLDCGLFERCESDLDMSAECYACWLEDSVKPRCGELTGAIICSVVPELTERIKTAILSVFGITAMVLDHDMKTELPINAKNPRELGTDLLAGAVGAVRHYPLPAVVADLGTATKFSVIGADGTYLGCAILPGIKMSFAALVKRAALLSEFEFHTPASPIGTDTPEALNAGAVYGTAALVDGMCEQYEAVLGTKPSVILTGGLSVLIKDFCKYEMTYDENIIAKGLKYIYDINREEQ